MATVASERGIGSGNIRGRVISNTSGTSPLGSIRCKSLQVGHLRYQLWICPGKSPFWKVTQRRFIKGHPQPNFARRERRRVSPGPQLLRIPQCMMLITPELVESCHRTVYCCTDGTDFPFIGVGSQVSLEDQSV